MNKHKIAALIRRRTNNLGWPSLTREAGLLLADDVEFGRRLGVAFETLSREASLAEYAGRQGMADAIDKLVYAVNELA